MIMELGVQTEPLDIAKTPTIFRSDVRSFVNKIPDPRPRTPLATGEVLAQATPSKIYCYLPLSQGVDSRYQISRNVSDRDISQQNTHLISSQSLCQVRMGRELQL